MAPQAKPKPVWPRTAPPSQNQAGPAQDPWPPKPKPSRTRKCPHTRVQAPMEPAIVHMAQGTAEAPAGSHPSASVHLGLPGSQPENTARLSPHPILPPAPSRSGDFRSCKPSQGHPLALPLSPSLQQGTHSGLLTGTLRRPERHTGRRPPAGRVSCRPEAVFARVRPPALFFQVTNASNNIIMHMFEKIASFMLFY